MGKGKGGRPNDEKWMLRARCGGRERGWSEGGVEEDREKEEEEQWGLYLVHSHHERKCHRARFWGGNSEREERAVLTKGCRADLCGGERRGRVLEGCRVGVVG